MITMASFGVHQIGVIRIEQDACYVEIFQPFVAGLRHIEKFSHIFVIWWISLRDNPQDRTQLLVTPPKLEKPVETGVFSCRSPSRPNPIGLTIVELIKKENDTLLVRGLDAFNLTPVLDIKPFYFWDQDKLPGGKS